MSRLTVKEKEHWIKRVEQRINKAIDALSEQHPDFMEELQSKSESKALETLGVFEMKQQLDALQTQIKGLQNEKSRLACSYESKITGKPESYCRDHFLASDVDRIIKTRQSAVEQELLAQSSIGQRLLALRREEEQVLDTIWMATTHRHIQDVWRRLDEVIGDESTELQQDIIDHQE